MAQLDLTSPAIRKEFPSLEKVADASPCWKLAWDPYRPQEIRLHYRSSLSAETWAQILATLDDELTLDHAEFTVAGRNVTIQMPQGRSVYGLLWNALGERVGVQFPLWRQGPAYLAPEIIDSFHRLVHRELGPDSSGAYMVAAATDKPASDTSPPASGAPGNTAAGEFSHRARLADRQAGATQARNSK